MLLGPFSDIWICLWHPGPFHAFRISCSAKTFTRWLPSNVCVGWLCLICVTGALLEWCRSNLIPLFCNLYVSNNFQLKKLWVLIKEALVVFHWVTLRIIHLYIIVYKLSRFPLLGRMGAVPLPSSWKFAPFPLPEKILPALEIRASR